jgi:hypothetical protein
MFNKIISIMEKNKNKDLSKKDDILFMFEDDYASESAIYFKIDSEEFKNENDLLFNNPVNPLFWEENDDFNVYH